MDTLRSPDTFDTHLGEWASANVQPFINNWDDVETD